MPDPCKKNYDQPRQHVNKQRYHFADKGPSSQSYGFSSSNAWMRDLDHKESWAPKNWCFWTVALGDDSWESLGLQGDQTILKEINPEYSLEGLMLKLNLQYFGHLMQRTDWLEKNLMLGKIESRRRRGRQREGDKMVDGITDSMGLSLSRLWEMVEDRESLCPAVHGVAKSRTRLSDWTSLKQLLNRILKPSISRVKLSGNSYFSRAWLGSHSIDCGRNQKWLARPPSDSPQSFGAQGQLSLRETVWCAWLT